VRKKQGFPENAGPCGECPRHPHGIPTWAGAGRAPPPPPPPAGGVALRCAALGLPLGVWLRVRAP